MHSRRSALASAILCLASVACSAPAPPHSPALTLVPTPTPTPGTAAPPITVPPTPSATPSLEPRELHPDDVSALVDRGRVEDHLAALAEITRRHGGHRATGSDAFDAAHAYARDMLEAAGLEVEARPFASDAITGTNLVAERPGRTHEVVMLGAHLDTVAGSPGMNDNGSGVAAVLALAETLTDLPAPERTIRLAIWDAEEGGPFGSRAYVASLSADERDRIVAYLNLDIIGSPNPLRLVYDEADAAPGSDAITRLFIEVLEDRGLATGPIDLRGASDHGPFVEAGIPTGGIFAGGHEPVTEAEARRFGAEPGVPADACVHRPCDTLDNVDAATTTELGGVAADVLVALARADR